MMPSDNKRHFPGKLVIGLTGTIASGKSTVGEYLSSKASLYIDADLIGREVVSQMKQKLAELFGETILKDGEIDRKELGRIVFSDPEKLRLLNQTVHPKVCEKIKESILAAKDGLIVVEAIELLRSDLKDMVDRVWVVYAEPSLRIQRMVMQRGLSEPMARDRIRSQWDDETYVNAADTVIRSTDGPVAELYAQIERALLNERV